MFLDLGRTLAKRELWEKALECLAAVQECDQVWASLYEPELYADGRLRTLPQSFTMLQSASKPLVSCPKPLRLLNGVRILSSYVFSLITVVENDPDNSDAKYRLAEVLEQSGQKDRALELIKKRKLTPSEPEPPLTISYPRGRAKRQNSSSSSPSPCPAEEARSKR